MLVFYFFGVLFLIFENVTGQNEFGDTEIANSTIRLCDVCTCSEIHDIDGTHIVFNIQCSELDRIKNVPDLDKIEWPENPNGLKISATFEGLGISTLSKLPPNSQVETLRFSNNAIKTYWPDPFSDVPNVKKLSLYQNDLTLVTPDLFTNIKQLEELDLSFNKLPDFNAMDFESLRRVKKFILQSNQLKKIPIEALQPMTALEDLDLSKNGIYDLLLQKSGTDALKGLKRLNLSGNRIRSVMKDSFPLNNTIELLDLSNNIIELVEENSFMSCANLRELNLAQNNITFIFALPPTLQIAILKVNTLHHWPKFPSGITYVDISYNRLTDMYEESDMNFDNLEVLNVGGNQIKEINIEKKLPKLFTFDVSYNLLEEIPKSLNSQNFPNLEELRLDGNSITSVYFKNIIAVKTLYMNDLNNIVVLEDKALSNVIGRNSEGGIQKNCFSFYMSNCRFLSEIKEGAFDGTSVCMLDISKNNLTKLPKSMLDWSVATEGVNLQWNPWDCSCELQWVLDDLLPRLYNSQPWLLTELRCTSPRALDGIRLVHLYNWTDQVMCSEAYARSGPSGNYLLAPATSRSAIPELTTTNIILLSCIVVLTIIAIILIAYLLKTRRKHRIHKAAMKRKRQSYLDTNSSSNGINKEQLAAFNST